ncbi:MAG TPA: hypothetical protein VIL35_05070 [Vicinamibacterales bacterium]
MPARHVSPAEPPALDRGTADQPGQASKTRSAPGWAVWLGGVIVALVCGLPLFFGLDRTDLQNDEAIYSYAVDRMVEGVGWITPRASPTDTAFLEKPPLKMWMVAVPISLGLLPHDEHGMRFIDALLGGIALLYVYVIGVRLGGPWCGGIAAFVLFLFPPLIFEHGFRSNNMESTLVLSQTAGAWHFARWLDPDARARSRGHAYAAALYFVLGFMTKFVAALFLPFVCVVAAATWRPAWTRLLTGWREWGGAALVAVVAIVPWFAYQTWQTGAGVWQVMLGEHVYTRFTGALDPSHLEPWSFYFEETWRHLTRAGTAWVVVAGLVALIAGAWRSAALLPRLLVVWALVPPVLLSFGTSKLYHYLYPFLPPLGLAAGYLAGIWIAAFSRHVLPLVRRRLPGPLDRRASSAAAAARTAAAILSMCAFVLAGWTIVGGSTHLEVAGATIFRNSSVARPLIVAALLAWIAGYPRVMVQAVALLPFAALLPLTSYDELVAHTQQNRHPLRAIRDCGLQLQASGAPVAPGFYNAASREVYHSYFYYLRHLGARLDAISPDPAELHKRVAAPGAQTPVLLSQADYNRWAFEEITTSAPGGGPQAPSARAAGITAGDGIIVLLPGPYQACVQPAVDAGGRQATTRGGRWSSSAPIAAS